MVCGPGRGLPSIPSSRHSISRGPLINGGSPKDNHYGALNTRLEREQEGRKTGGLRLQSSCCWNVFRGGASGQEAQREGRSLDRPTREWRLEERGDPNGWEFLCLFRAPVYEASTLPLSHAPSPHVCSYDLFGSDLLSVSLGHSVSFLLPR